MFIRRGIEPGHYVVQGARCKAHSNPVGASTQIHAGVVTVMVNEVQKGRKRGMIGDPEGEETHLIHDRDPFAPRVGLESG